MSDRPSSDEVYAPIKLVCKRYRCSKMWVERKLKADPEFPRPVKLGRLRFWRLDELEEWERACARRSHQ